MANVAIPQGSRYKDTPVYEGTRGPEFALMEPPVEALQESRGYRTHRVRSHELGFLDVLAVRYYGVGTERLWWFLALSNAILDSETEMQVGQTLLVPPRTLAVQFRTRGPALAS